MRDEPDGQELWSTLGFDGDSPLHSCHVADWRQGYAQGERARIPLKQLTSESEHYQYGYAHARRMLQVREAPGHTSWR